MLSKFRISLVSVVVLVLMVSIGCTPQASETPVGDDSEQSVSSNDDEGSDSPILTEWSFDADEALRRQEETAETLGIPVDYENEIGMKLRLIPAGQFMMGSPEDEESRWYDEVLHRVQITNPYYLGVCEVTQGEWEAVMETTPWRGKNYAIEGADYPATYVSWEDAQEFCQRLSVWGDMPYRLPTEAEWEYACRVGSTTAYFFGDSSSNLGEYAWYSENTEDRDQQHPSEVGGKQANAWGLHDMHGNVWEWCHDWYDSDYDGAGTVDPRGPSTGMFREVRGGSWGDDPWDCRSANLAGYAPSLRYDYLGFRVACSVE